MLPDTLASFEVDAPETQRSKRALLFDASLDASRVTLVAADLNTELGLDRLVT